MIRMRDREAAESGARRGEHPVRSVTPAWLRWLLPVCAMAFMAGILLGRTSAEWHWALISLAVAAGACVLSVWEPRARCAAAAALVLCLGALLGWGTWHRPLPEERVWHVSGIVAEEIRDGSRTQHRTVLRNVTLDGAPLSGGAYWTFYSAELPEGLAPGVCVEGDFSLYHPGGAENPGGFDFSEYLLERGVHVGLYGKDNLRVSRDRQSLWGAAAALRHSLTRRLCDVMGEEAGGYAAAMLLGVRSLVPSEDRDAFLRLGIAHLLSVSGFHVGVLYAAFAWLLKKARVPRLARLPAIALLLAFYCLLTGLGAPVIRATALILLREYGALRHRKAEGLHMLSAAAIINLLINPAQLLSAGFHLSYGALLGIILVRPVLYRFPKPGSLRRRFRAADWLWNGFTTALAVQAGILLPQLYWYHELPLLSVFLNVFVLALASVVLILFWALLLIMFIPAVGPAFGALCGWMTEALTGAVRGMAQADWIVLWTRQGNLLTAAGWLLLLFGLCGLIRLRKGIRGALTATALAVIALSVIPWPHHGTEYLQFSVRSADAAVVWDEDRVWVIDTGEDSTLSNWLHQRRLGVDTLVISHLHADHMMGVEVLLADRIPIWRVLLPWGAERSAVSEDCLALLDRLAQSGTEILYASRGDTFDLPSGGAAVLWPEENRVRAGQDANHYSLALRLELKGVSLLTCGDLTREYEMYSAAPADILKVAHHGSAGSTSPEYLAAVAPKLMILSGGDRTRWQNTLAKAGDIPVYATQNVGAVHITLTPGAWTVSGFRTPGLETDDTDEPLEE